MSLRRGYTRQSSWMGRKILKKMQNLQTYSIETNLFWVSSHCGTQKNELADETDKAGSQICQNRVPLSRQAIVNAVRHQSVAVSGDKTKERLAFFDF